MENKSERVLAYTLAKNITNEELSEVSGGSNPLSWSTRPSGRASGTNGSWDASIDVVLDF